MMRKSLWGTIEMLATFLRGQTAAVLFFLALAPVLLPSEALGRQSAAFEVNASDDLRALLERAEARIANEQAEEAFALLSAVQTEHAGNPYFDYLLGVAALDSGRHSEAIFSLRRSIAVEPRYAGARMELARAYFESNNPELARPLFVALLDENPPPGVLDIIRQYISMIDAPSAAPRSRMRGYLESLAGYDSNANGSTADQQFLGFTLSPQNLETESPFLEVGAGFEVLVPTSQQFAWIASGRLGHRANSDASFVNSTLLSGFGGGTWQRGVFFGRAGLDAYGSTRDGDANEAYGGADLMLGRRLGADWDVTLGLRGGASRFADELEVLDVNRFLYSLGASRRFSPMSRLGLQLIGGKDNERQAGSPYGNTKAGARLSFDASTGGASFLHAALGTLTSDYDGLFFGLPREDTQVTVMLGVEFRDVWTEGLTLMPTYRYVDNDSDVALYKYDRTEIGLLLRWAP